MARVLVVEDEPALQQVLAHHLARAGHAVVPALTAAEGARLAREAQPDVILLDLMLPDGPGTELCRALQRDAATRDVPIVIVSARGSELDRVVGFELGAADYVVKPFSVRELVLRVAAILRRARAVPAPRLIEVGALRVDPDAHRVWSGGVEVQLTLLELRLLLALYEDRGRVQSRADLLHGVWGLDPRVTTRTVDTHVKRLRDKLGRAGEPIETVRGVGYRFAAPLARAGADAPR